MLRFMDDTFLTEAQARVLELRAKGLTQAEIARRLMTSRANICILERRAKENIARAERTLKLAAKLRAPVVLEVKQGDDILEVPKRLFKAADRAKIKVRMGTPDIVAKIREGAGDKLHGRSATKGFDVALTAEGEILIA
ncbi:MAG: Tfx family DNA-binding protein [Candidatus Hodarchaeaceae archaeon]|nr:Tfx family DNA-binding protein [Candidatus Hodarchaeaceae archaeon]